MIMLGIDAHKRSHTVVAVDELGRRLGAKTTLATTSADHLELIRWADQFGSDRSWAVEDCRHLSRQLERDMLAAGERLVRVPPKLMAHSRDAARTYGKSDPIDALAVARAALREPDLPTAYLDEAARELRLLVDHREDLIAERTRHINRLRWHLHDIDPSWDPKERALTTMKHLRLTEQRLALVDSVVGRIAADLVTGSGPDSRHRCPRVRAGRADRPYGHPSRGPRRRWGERRQVRRRGRQHRTVPQPPRIRPTQRNRANPGVVRQHRAASAQPCREPTAKRRGSPRRPDPGTIEPPSPRLPPAATGGRCHPQGSPPLTQATPLRRHLPRHAPDATPATPPPQRRRCLT